MEKIKSFIEVTRNLWNQKTPIHYHSAFYDNQSFINGRSSLNEIELGLLGDLKDKSVLHLQCHFGQDTISLSRLGAAAVGVDLSDKAIEKARELASITNSEARFIWCDVYDLPLSVDEQFDVVFTSYGTIGWLPDLNKWAEVVVRFLKPGGRLVFVEFHPVVWMFDDDFQMIKYRYFNSGPIMESTNGTYAEKSAPINLETVTWNHGVSEVVNSLIENGLEIMQLDEFDYSPYNCFNETVEVAPGKFRIKHLDNKIPMVYSIVAKKKKV